MGVDDERRWQDETGKEKKEGREDG